MKRCVRPALRFSDSSAKVDEVVAGGVAAAVVDMRGTFFLGLLGVCGVWKYACVCVRNDEVASVHMSEGDKTRYYFPCTSLTNDTRCCCSRLAVVVVVGCCG